MSKRFLKSATALLLSLVMMGGSINPVVLAETQYLMNENPTGVGTETDPENSSVIEEIPDNQDEVDEEQSLKEGNENEDEKQDVNQDETITDPGGAPNEGMPEGTVIDGEEKTEDQPVAGDNTNDDQVVLNEEEKPAETTSEAVVNEPEKTETEETLSPAFDQSAAINGVTITVTAPAGTFPENSTLKASQLLTGKDLNEVSDAIAEETKDAISTSFFDISVVDGDGNEVQPNGSVNISFKISLAANKALEPEVYHIPDEGGVEALLVSQSGDTLSVVSDGFSVYAVSFVTVDDEGTESKKTVYTSEITEFEIGKLKLTDLFTIGEIVPLPEAEAVVASITCDKDFVSSGFDSDEHTFENGFINIKKEFTSPQAEVIVTIGEIDYNFVFISSEEDPNKRITVHFDKGADNATGSMSDQVFTKNAGGKRLTANGFERDCYEFEGWYTEPDGEGRKVSRYENYSYTDILDLLVDKTSTVLTLYANWIPASYRVNYYRNHSNNDYYTAHSPSTFTYGTEGTLKDDPTWNTYTFIGWNTARDGSGDSYSGTIPATQGKLTNNTLNLYAQWVEIGNIEVIFDKNNVDAAGSMATQEFRTSQSSELRQNRYTLDGYNLKEWNTEKDGTGKSFESGTSYRRGDFNGYDTNHVVTLYAIWEPVKTITVKFSGNAEDVTGSMSDQVFTENAQGKRLTTNGFDRDCYTFTGWNTQENGLGKTVPANSNYTYATLSDYLSEETATVLTLYAQWIPASYRVNYYRNHSNNDYYTAHSPSTFTYGTEGTLKDDPTWNTYTFIGWNTARDGSGDSYSGTIPATQGKLTNNTLNLYAQWVEIGNIEVIFDKNNVDAAGSMATQEFRTSQSSELRQNRYTLDGYNLKEWNTEKDGTGKSFESGTSYRRGDFNEYAANQVVTLYAIWEADEIKITSTDDLDFKEIYGDDFYIGEEKIPERKLDVSDYYVNFLDQFNDDRHISYLDGYYYDGTQIVDSEGNIVVEPTYFTESRKLELKLKSSIVIDISDPTSSNVFGGWYMSDDSEKGYTVMKNGGTINTSNTNDLHAIWYKAEKSVYEWTKGSGAYGNLRFIDVSKDYTHDIILERFEGAEDKAVYVDNKAVTKYGYYSGSLVIQLNPDYLEGLDEGNHNVRIHFDGVDVSTVLKINPKPSSSGSTPKKDNVVTCQMAGYPSNYAWNESAKACQPGYIDAGGVFHPYGAIVRRVPNTADRDIMIHAWIAMLSITIGLFCAVKLLHEDWEV